MGLMARESAWKFLAARRQAIVAMCVSQAEALALLHGCELSISQRFRCIILESDSLCLNGKLEDGSWRAYPILVQVQKFQDSFQDYRWSWTPRSANKATDMLASQKSKKMCGVLWVDRPPSSLVFVLHFDGLPCPH